MSTTTSEDNTSETICQAKNEKSIPVAVKSCKESCLIRDEMERLSQGIDEPLDGVVCENYECQHNIFWSALFKKQNGQTSQWKRKDSRLAKTLRNCMCLLDENDRFSASEDLRESGQVVPGSGLQDDRVCSLEEIAQTYGISRQNITVVEKRALKHLEQLLRQRGIDETCID